MKMMCSGSQECKNKECYHYLVHDDVPPGEEANYCVGKCFNGSVCREIVAESREKKIACSTSDAG